MCKDDKGWLGYRLLYNATFIGKIIIDFMSDT